MGGGAWTAAPAWVSGSSPIVRLARESDLGAVVQIERDSFADPWSRESFASSLALDRMRFLVAEDADQERTGGRDGGDAILGYVVALFILDEAEIADLAVSPQARRRGIGGLLLDRVAIEAARAGVRSLYLEVRESNSAARALYESRSFAQVGRRRGYYQHPPEDALLLKRELAPA